MPTATNETEIDRYKQVLRQAEFLNKLSALLNEYHASIRIDDRRDDLGGPVLEIDACGTWIPDHEITSLDVDACIDATKKTIEHAKALEP